MFIFFIFQFLDDILRDRELDIVLDRVLDGEGVGLVEGLVQRPHHRLGRHLAPTEGGEEGESGEDCPSLHVMSNCPPLEAVCLTLLGAVGETEKAPQLINIMQCQATG